jgi:membrane protein DedA with SNARE-associated domain
VENLAQDFTTWLDLYGYPVLFVLVLLENAGVPVPGETAVLLSGFLASQPDSPFSIPGVILTTIVSAILGDNAGFWLGRRWARARLQEGRRFLFLTPKTLAIVEGYFHHYGTWTIFFARFITGIRVVGALAAGTAGMPWRRFLLANAGGALVWAVTMTLLGYFFGHSWQLLHQWIGRGGLIILGSVALVVGLPYLLHRLHRLSPIPWQTFLRMQVWQGIFAAALETVCIALLVLVARDRGPGPGDVQIQDWVAAHEVPWLAYFTVAGSYLGTLSGMLVVTLSTCGYLRWRGAPWHEVVAAGWALLASEGVGLLLLALIRQRGIEPAYALAWPFGFAGLASLRGAAVLGMTAHLMQRCRPDWGQWPRLLAAVCVLWIGASVIWLHEQNVSEVLLEYAAGAVVLFAGLWWLEGYGPEPLPSDADGPPATVNDSAVSRR